MAHKLLSCWLALTFAVTVTPVAAQQPREPLKQFLDDAERQRDKKSVDDLIRRLEQPGTPPAKAPVPPVAAPAPPAAPLPPPGPPPVATPQPPPQQPSPGDTPVAPPASPPVAGPPAPTPPIAAPAPPAIPLPPLGPPPATPPHPPIATPKPSPPAGPPETVPMDKAAEMARRRLLPTADLEIFFPFNGSAITPDAVATLRLLGEALSDPRFRTSRFIIAGHTDGRGGVAYNRALSQARADAVRRWLIATYKLEPRNLTARGFGKSQLKNPANPLADENRRVQVINWTSLDTGPRRKR
jgi:outer membrane protein OmpA-like peptidoglycan-associated protein